MYWMNIHIFDNARANVMWVDVVRLRRKGERLSPAEVAGAAPVRGRLQLDYVRPGYYRGQRDAPLLAGLLSPGESEWALPPLDHARVVKIRAGGGMLIVGLEEVPRMNHRGSDIVPQAWWVRAISESPPDLPRTTPAGARE